MFFQSYWSGISIHIAHGFNRGTGGGDVLESYSYAPVAIFQLYHITLEPSKGLCKKYSGRLLRFAGILSAHPPILLQPFYVIEVLYGVLALIFKKRAKKGRKSGFMPLFSPFYLPFGHSTPPNSLIFHNKPFAGYARWPAARTQRTPFSVLVG